MLDEIGHLLSRLRSESGKAVRVERLLGSSVSNVLCQYVTGKRYDYDHPVRTMLDDCLTPRGRGARPSLFGYLAFMPTLMHLLSLLTGGRSRSAFQKRMQRVQDHVRQRVRELEAQPLPDSPSCFIESYLKEMRDGTTFDHDHLMGCVFTFFIAGVNVMTDYVTWFLLFMTLNPDVQQRMREEVDHVVGRKTLSSKYRPLMPYTQAVMLELHRVANIAPSGLNHALAQDRQVAGYLLPKGTQILLSSFLVHTDPEYFPEPNVFRPERFLAPDGSFVHDERVVHFGIGKRSCPGEPIAQNQLFLYLTSVLQTFLISSPPHSHYCDTGVMDFGGRVPVSPVRIVFSPRD